MSIQVTINGEQRTFDRSLTVAELVDELALKPKGVAVELNREIVPKSQWQQTSVSDGDEIEIVTFVGGG